MKKEVNGIIIECVQGDIAGQKDFLAVVNAANAQLMPGAGVAGALHRAAGPGLAQECKPMAPIKPGEAVISSGHNLPNKFVIHCLGPVYGRDMPGEELLASCYQRALELSEENNIDSIAFPAISTGIFGYPMQEAALVAFNTVIKSSQQLHKVKRIRFVLFKEEYVRIHERVLCGLI
ncbi:MAG: macro domain-containing protein [Candidatus Omnitrophica bacterium]|nr:macro domain-containing protein [Candidatus Omnitrophota bacterium]